MIGMEAMVDTCARTHAATQVGRQVFIELEWTILGSEWIGQLTLPLWGIEIIASLHNQKVDGFLR